MTTNSEQLFELAQSVLVGGVNSPVRAFKSVGGTPVFMKEAQGPYLRSADNALFIDYVLAWGPMLLGHADAEVVRAITQQAGRGSAFGAPTEAETILAQLIQYFFPSMEKLRLVSSGTEATMSALRVARGYTKREMVIKFTGCYHGHADSLLVSAGSGGLTFGVPDSDGVPAAFVGHTAVLPYNDCQSVSDLFHFKGDEIAAVILEPVCGNMGVVLPDPEFLKTLRLLCTRYGAILIFDEVMTGFRVDLGGAQALYSILPDMTCLGKVIGGGLPCAAYGGRSDIMAKLAPEGGVYQAGTMSGNSVAVAAGIATLEQLKGSQKFEHAKAMTKELVTGFKKILVKKKLPYTVPNCGTMFSVFFCEGVVNSLEDTKRVDRKAFAEYYHRMLAGGIYMAPSPFESNFMSAAHQVRDVEKTIQMFEKCL